MIQIRTAGKKRSGARPTIAAMAVALVLMGWLGLSPNTGLFASTVYQPSGAAVNPENSNQPCPPWPHEISDLNPDPSVTFGRLANGFRYSLKENNRPEDRVSVHLYIRAGSLNETEAQQGLAHFLEHMLFNGSTHFPPGELIRYFQSIGMQFGNDANAHTGLDETVYDIILPAGDAESLKKGLLVIHDYATGALLLKDEIQRERGVILAEMRSRDSAEYRTFEASLQFELPDYLVSKRLPIGKREVIENANRKLLKDFYDDWYRPENMVLIMVGDFSIPMAQKLIEKQFSGLTPRSAAPAPPALDTFAHKGLQIFHHYEPEVGGTTVSIETVYPGGHVTDSLALRRQQMMEEMADRIVQNRLNARLKAPEAPFTSAAVDSGTYLNRIRYAKISADCAAENWKQSLAVIEQELRRARLYGFDASELARVKKDTLTRLGNAVREAPTRNSTTLAREIIRDLADNRVVQSPDQEKTKLAPMVKSVTLADLQRAFNKNWPDDHRLILVTGSADLKTLSPKNPESWIRDVYLASASTVVESSERHAVASFPYLPEPENTGAIAFQEVVEDLGITRIRLGNGIQINLKRTNFKTNEVLANLIFGQGKSAEPEALPGISQLAEATVNESGLGAMDTNELERALAGKSTYVDFRITETHFKLFGESVSGELPLLFQLIYAHIADPGLRDDALVLARQRLRQDYQSLTRSIEGMMRIKGMNILAGGDSRFGMPPFEKIEAIRLDDIRSWIVPQLESAPMELSVVGDFDENEAIELARRYLGELPDRRLDPANLRTDLPDLPKGTLSRIDVNTQIPKAMVVAAWQTEDFWDISRTRRLSVLADIFSERLRQRIREKLGVSYSPYAFNRSSRAYKGYGVLQAHVNVAPDQTETVLAEIKTIAGDLGRNRISADELARTVDPILTSIKELRQTNGYWLNSVMTGSNRHAQQFEWARSFQEDYASVTAEELATLAATYLTDERAAAITIRPNQQSTD